ncbi:hypothetical protein [Brevundimonas sp.]
MPVTHTTTYPPGFIKKLRDRVAEVIAASSANDVPAICVRHGLEGGDRSEAMGGKIRYVNQRLLTLPNYRVIEVAESVAMDDGDVELLRLLDVPKTQPVPAQAPTPPSGRRTYYSERNGRTPNGGRLDRSTFIALFRSEFTRLEEAGFFAEHFGFSCVDADRIDGLLGSDINARMLFSIGKPFLWPIDNQCANYDQDDLFSVIEFLFDHVSKPLTGTFHQYNDCGMHWNTFDRDLGQAEFRSTVNVLLDRYEDGWELNTSGEILERAPEGTESLLTAELPYDRGNVQSRVQSAIKKFRQRQATPDDRRDAVRDLGDALEFLRPEAKLVMTKKDDGALFEIANNFGIRHNREGQQTDYDQTIWLSWMFYFYLATIHAVVRLINKSKAD